MALRRSTRDCGQGEGKGEGSGLRGFIGCSRHPAPGHLPVLSLLSDRPPVAEFPMWAVPSRDTCPVSVSSPSSFLRGEAKGLLVYLQPPSLRGRPGETGRGGRPAGSDVGAWTGHIGRHNERSPHPVPGSCMDLPPAPLSFLPPQGCWRSREDNGCVGDWQCQAAPGLQSCTSA